MLRTFIFICLVLVLAACDPMAQRPTPQVIVITDTPTLRPSPAVSPTPSATRTPIATPTPDFTPTPTPFPCDEDGQIIEIDDFRSETLRENFTYTLYLPPCYQESLRRFPLLMLLSNSATGNPWLETDIVNTLDQGIRLGVLPPMIVVMAPLGNAGQRDNFPPDPSYETFIVEELLPAVETDLCVWEDRDQLAIGGIGRGGFWAYSIGMRLPETFGIIGAHSGIFEDSDVPPQFDPLDIARNSTLLPQANLRMYIDNAADNQEARNQQILSDRLTARQIAHTYIINPVGGADVSYWSAHLSEYLTFYGEEWTRNYSELPSCLEPSP